jgi:hypothetical protein
VTVTGGSRHQATADRRGAYTITGIKAGTAEVSIRRLGYEPYAGTVTIYDGDNRLDIVLVPQPQSLDTMATREQQLWREYPALREFEENRRIGLGQFVTRADLAKLQGGFIVQAFSQMRGLVPVRLQTQASPLWLASKYMPAANNWCYELEDGGGVTTPKDAACNYCFPEVYLDKARLSGRRLVPNVGRLNPDQLQAIEVYQGPAETPAKYASFESGCGVIVFHTRAVESKPRRIASFQDQPTRSRVFATVSASAATSGAGCADCGLGSAGDAMLGYTFRDRFVVGGRYATWRGTQGGAQAITMRQAFVEWYPRPDPGRYKWFINAGGGTMSVDLNTRNDYFQYRDSYSGKGLPSVFAGTGSDIRLVRRLVVTPFISYTRTVTGKASAMHCIINAPVSGAPVEQCGSIPEQPRTFSLTQVGTRFGWR